MKKNIYNLYFLPLLLVVFFMLPACNRTGTDANKTTDSISKETNNTDANKLQEYVIPKELKYFEKAGNFLVDKFYPIGWSKDGKIAYIVEPADEAMGMYFFQLIIFNTQNDKEEWSFKPEPIEKGTFKSVWEKNYELFKTNLNNFKIIQQTDFAINKPSFSYKSKDYALKLETKLETDEFGFGFEVIKEVKVLVDSKQMGLKQILSQKLKSSMVISASATGSIISPFEEKMVVITYLERVGYEGPPNVIQFLITGCNLSEGFKKNANS